MKPIMEALDLRYSYPSTRKEALRSLTLTIPQGKKTAICGHNGSGKSTFFLHAIGIHRPASGQLKLKGAPLSYRRDDLLRLRRQVGLVFQDPEQQLILNTPYEDVSYGLRNAGLPEDEIAVRTERMLLSMGLKPLADTPLHQLSLGQKKRVALAGVLVLEPELLLLDEPTAYLDRLSERQLLEELDLAQEQGITVAMATHDMNLAYAWADWVLVMDQGACCMAGPSHEVFADEEKLRSLGLEPPMLLELWQALPAAVRKSHAPPRSIEAMKAFLQNGYGTAGAL